jgi:two-component system capsular synthesis sensor histidine kinase RcsC
MQERSWFGYTSGFRELVLKKSLPPSSLSIVYSCRWIWCWSGSAC